MKSNQLANKILEKYWDGLLPVNVVLIADKLNIKLNKFNGNGNRGMLKRGKEKNEIFYDPQNSKIMNRFVVAHLLGKILLNNEDVNSVTVDNLSSEAKFEKDRQANDFALNLLVPKSGLKLLIESGKIKDVNELSKMFEVSPAAMAIAINNHFGF